MTLPPSTADAAASTVLDTLRTKLRACAETPDDTAPPVAILWTDPGSQWLPAMEMFGRSVSEVTNHRPAYIGSRRPSDRAAGPSSSMT
jgi:hypothetical protein